MKEEADQSLFTVKTSNGDDVDPKEAIFPILKNEENGNVKFIGTGFFVTRFGFFISARHVFEDVLDDKGNAKSGLNIIQFYDNFKFYWRPVTGFVLHNAADVAIGVCTPMKHQITSKPLFNKVLALSMSLPKVGENIWTFAYPGTTVTQSEKTEIKYNAKFYAGIINEYYPNGRDRVILPFPCFRTSIVLHGGSSGGPVFGENRKVIGINSTSFDSEMDISHISRIHDVLDLRIPNAVMPNESEPLDVSLRDLIKTNHVAI
ncbi:MAG: serine protease [Streptococcus sp.]|nr:serine protease [Streptococcus sp.]